MRGSVDFDFFSQKNKTFKQKKVYQVNRHTMGYLWTKYLKLRFLGLVPLFPDLTRWLGTAALKYLGYCDCLYEMKTADSFYLTISIQVIYVFLWREKGKIDITLK